MLRHEAGVEERARLADAVLARGRDLAPEVDDCRACRATSARSPVCGLRAPSPRPRGRSAAPRGAGSCPPCRTRRSGAGTGSSPGPSSRRRRSSRPSASARIGRSFWTSCSWRFLVPVEITTRRLRLDRGQQVRERLAGAGAGLGEQQPAVLQHVRHGLGELALRRALLVAGQHASERAARCEEVGRMSHERVILGQMLSRNGSDARPPPTTRTHVPPLPRAATRALYRVFLRRRASAEIPLPIRSSVPASGTGVPDSGTAVPVISMSNAVRPPWSSRATAT